jgi:ankyrin repeat protein
METIEKYIRNNYYDKLNILLLTKDKKDIKNVLNLKMKGYPLLHRVEIKKFNSLIIDLLIEFGLNINDTDDIYGCNILMKAIEEKNEEMILYLLRTNINLNAQDKKGQTALHYAVYNLDYKTIDILLKFDSNSNIQDIHGNTAIMYIGYGLSNQMYTKQEKNELERKIVKLFMNEKGTGKFQMDILLKNNEGLKFSDIVEQNNKNLYKFFVEIDEL